MRIGITFNGTNWVEATRINVQKYAYPKEVVVLFEDKQDIETTITRVFTGLIAQVHPLYLRGHVTVTEDHKGFNFRYFVEKELIK